MGGTLFFHQADGYKMSMSRQAWHGKTLPEVGGEVSIRHFELLSAARFCQRPGDPGAPTLSHPQFQPEINGFNGNKNVSHGTS